MASKIYEYGQSEGRCDVNSETIKRNYEASTEIPIIAKGNIYQGITAQW